VAVWVGVGVGDPVGVMVGVKVMVGVRVSVGVTMMVTGVQVEVGLRVKVKLGVADPVGVKVAVERIVTGVQVEVGLKVEVKVAVGEPVGVKDAVSKIVTGWVMVTGEEGLELLVQAGTRANAAKERKTAEIVNGDLKKSPRGKFQANGKRPRPGLNFRTPEKRRQIISPFFAALPKLEGARTNINIF